MSEASDDDRLDVPPGERASASSVNAQERQFYLNEGEPCTCMVGGLRRYA